MNQSAPISDSQYRRFHSLMPHRVREVLLISSPYDAFIMEEDYGLTEQIFDRYKSLELSSAPRVTQASTEKEAFELLGKFKFDLVITMMRIADGDFNVFARKIKREFGDIPVVLLAYDGPEMKKLYEYCDAAAIDGVFIWNGNSEQLLPIIKFIEDKANVDHDIETADVRVILIVEDSVRYYSHFLGILYPELMKQSSSLHFEAGTRLHKLMHMRARPKVLLATHYKEAVALFKKYRNNVLAIISDVSYPIDFGGRAELEAGFRLVDEVRTCMPDLPMLLQSANDDFMYRAGQQRVLFLNKQDPNLGKGIRGFLRNFLGFGDFIFRMPDGTEVGKASDLREFEKMLEVVPDESIRYHGSRNHISNWLMARSEFDLAGRIRAKKMQDFDDIDQVRKYLVQELHAVRKRKRRRVITEFHRETFEPENRFLKIGEGSIGGKARGIAFVNSSIETEELSGNLGIVINVPQTFVIATDYFDQFLEENNLEGFAYRCDDDRELAERFVKAPLPWELLEHLNIILEQVEYPLAVRSSSLLEDSYYQPFAGIYSTYMLPNNSHNISERLESLSRAVKLVYASTFKQNAKSYLRNTARLHENEKMAVVIQGLVGCQYGDRFYPTFSGVAQSYNFYPLGPQQATDGITMLALGLGRMVVDGGRAVRFSPKHPQIMPQFANPELILKNSQRRFYAMDTSADFLDTDASEASTLKLHELDQAIKDGTMAAVGSTYDHQDGVVRDGVSSNGVPVVTFANILKYDAIRLSDALIELMSIFRRGMGSEVEMEFACDMGDWGKRLPRGQKRIEPSLAILQLRPIVTETVRESLAPLNPDPEEVLCRTAQSLGHGLMKDIRDIVYVKWSEFDSAMTKEIAREVGRMNKRFTEEQRPYILIGPGRWGSSDPWLGIPVQWADISLAKVMVEASPKDFMVDPSQGTHFFQNITSLKIGYLTLPPGADGTGTSREQFVDFAWMDQWPAESETRFLRHIRSEDPFVVNIDGREGTGMILKPTKEIEETEEQI